MEAETIELRRLMEGADAKAAVELRIENGRLSKQLEGARSAAAAATAAMQASADAGAAEQTRHDEALAALQGRLDETEAALQQQRATSARLEGRLEAAAADTARSATVGGTSCSSCNSRIACRTAPHALPHAS